MSIYQVKKEVCDEIEAMLDEFPLEHTIRRYESKNGKITPIYSIFAMRLCKYLKQFGICYDKYVPYEIKKQGKDMLRIFYDWFVMGDGRKRGLGHGNYYSDDVFSTSKQLVMDLNEIQLKIGYCGSYHVEDRHYDRLIEGRVIKGENSQNMHFSHRQHTKYISLQPKSFKIEKIDYEGMVYCLEVKNHTFYTMCHNGFCLWSGNSSTLSGHDVAHVITNLEWQGRTLIGEMDLHLSPGYRRYGVCSTSGDLVANLILDDILIGVSSRAVGSVEEKLGVLLVGDDLELLAFDVVMENSTPGAKIGLSREDLQQYIESDETNKNKPLVNEKLERVKKILL